MLARLRLEFILQKNIHSFKKLEIITSYQEFKDYRKNLSDISFVPTMGNLHAGHIALVQEAKSQKNYVVASIFINPLQFNDKRDFKNYPKTFDDDIHMLETNGCDLLFMPDESILDNITEIKAPEISNFLCGKNRPGHFDGVLTIVNRLFDIVRPTKVFFGKKDYQQFILVSNFINENKLPIEIIGVETVRDANGLALSSRNNHLNTNEKKIAMNLHVTLNDLANNLDDVSNDLIKLKMQNLTNLGFEVDYLTICDPNLLNPVSNFKKRPLLLAIAASLNGIRLIDNLLVKN